MENEEFVFVDGYEIYEDYKDCEAVGIINKCIGDMSDQVVIAGEINSQYIQFMVEKISDGADLSDKSFHIHYAYENGKGSESVPVNVMCNDKYLAFGWIVPPQATLKAGKVAIMIWCSGVNSKNKDFLWKTKTRTFAVQGGAIIGSGIDEPDEEWFLDFVRKMNELLENSKKEIKTMIANADLGESLDNKVDKEEGKSLTSNDFTDTLLDKLNHIEDDANNYVHPDLHSASMILEDETHRFVTDEEKAKLKQEIDNIKAMLNSIVSSLHGVTTVIRVQTDLNYNDEGGYVTTVKNEYGGKTSIATTRNGYRFAGWYKAETELWNDQAELTHEDELGVVVAKFVSDGSYIVLFMSDNSLHAEQLVLAGETVVAPNNPEKEGYTFTGWDFDLTAPIDADRIIKALFVINRTITFYHTVYKDNRSTSIVVPENVASIEFPADQTALGYTFMGWDMTEDEVLAALAYGDVTVNTVFEKIPVTYSVELVSGQTSGTYEGYLPATVTADEPAEGQQFSHWETTEDGIIVSYKTAYTFYLIHDTKLTAVYVSEDDVVQKTPLLSITNVTLFPETNKISFNVTRYLPDTMTIVSHGAILNNTGLSEDEFIIGADGVLKGTSTSTGNNGDYTLTKSNAAGTIWYARGYVIYQDTDGVQHTLYSAIVSATLE